MTVKVLLECDFCDYVETCEISNSDDSQIDLGVIFRKLTSDKQVNLKHDYISNLYHVIPGNNLACMGCKDRLTQEMQEILKIK